MSETREDCRVCNESYELCSDGYDGLCPGCADKANEIAESDHWKCPKCASVNLEVVVEVSQRLLQEEDNFQTVDSAVNNDHEWGANSCMTCMDCGEQDIAGEFHYQTGWGEAVEQLRDGKVTS